MGVRQSMDLVLVKKEKKFEKEESWKFQRSMDLEYIEK